MTKNTLATIGILATLLLSLGVVSAASLSTDDIVIPTTVNDNETSFQITFDLTNDGADADINWSTSELTEGTGNFSFSHDQIDEGETISIITTITIPTGQSGNIAGEIWADPSGGGASKNVTFSVPITVTDTPTPTGDSWCADDFDGEKGDLEIKNFYIDYNGNGDDEEWEALDEIIIEVDVKNTDSDDRVDDILAEIQIRDSNDEDVTSDFDFEDEEKSLGRISKKSTETAIFTITELPTDVEEDTYKIYVRAYDDDDPDLQCTSKSDDFNDEDELFHEFDVVREDEAVIVKESDLMTETILASCGDKGVEVSFMVYNIGDDEEDKVLVQLYNSELGIDEFYVIDSLRSGKGKTATFFIDIPKELSKTRYSLDILTFFAYDDDEDELERTSYDENSNEIDRDFSIRLEILSCQESPEVTIQIDLESETVVEKQVVIKATITNQGEDNDFVISTSDLESWAESITVSPLTTSIDEGESVEVTITFIPTIAGEHTFKINVISDGEPISKSAVINIKEKPSLFSGISNTMLYTVAGIIAILIIIFLALIVRVSRRQAKPQF